MSVYLFSAALISAAVSWLVSELSRRGGVLDFPEARSLHATPTPRSGGLGILAGCGAGALVLLAAPVGAPGMAAALAFAGAQVTSRRGRGTVTSRTAEFCIPWSGEPSRCRWRH